MSEPIQNNPFKAGGVPNPRPAGLDEQSTRVSETALRALENSHLFTPSADLDPSKVKLVVPDIKWRWDAERKGNVLIWKINIDPSDPWPDETIDDSNEEYFPVLQPKFKDLKPLMDSDKEFLEEMGLSLDSDVFITPTREQLVINYRSFQQKNPGFPELKFKIVDRILEPDAFILTVLESDLILSDNQELIHDYAFHILPTLLGIHQAPESYRTFKDWLEQTATIFITFLEKEPGEILAELNKSLEPPLEERYLTDTIATLKYMVGAALDILSGEILEYNNIVKEGEKGVKELFFAAISNPLKDQRFWKKSLETAVPTLQKDFLENYPTPHRWGGILHAMFIAAGLR